MTKPNTHIAKVSNFTTSLFLPLEKTGVPFKKLKRNHYTLLRMVDNKSSIILTINSIIISFLMSALYLAPDTDKEIVEFGAKTLNNFCFVSMIIALISMLPHRYYSRGYKNSSYNGILYSQNFSKLSIEDYRKEMKRVMDSGENVYKEMIDDLYFLGKVISIKQKLVVFSFVVFLIGIAFIGVYSIYYGV